MRMTIGAALSALFLLACVLPARAHHAFSSEFDAKKPVTIDGTLSKMEWVNPHAWIHIDVKKPDGRVEKWMVEGSTPNTLLRRGIHKTDLPIGARVKVSGYRAKDGSLRANGTNITLADGRFLFLGSPGTGAPSDNRGEPNQ